MNDRFEFTFTVLCTTLFIVGWLMILTSNQPPVITHVSPNQPATTMAVEAGGQLYPDGHIGF